MSSSSDIEKLFDHFGGDANAYQEIGRENEARSARTRWPLLVTLDLTQPTIPAIGQSREQVREALAHQAAPAVDRQDETPSDVVSVTRAKAPLFTRSHRRDIPPVVVATAPVTPSGTARFGTLEANEEAEARINAVPPVTAPAPPRVPQAAPARPVAAAPVLPIAPIPPIPPVMPAASIPSAAQFPTPAVPVTQPRVAVPPNAVMPRAGLPAFTPRANAPAPVFTSAPVPAPTWTQAPAPAHPYATAPAAPRPSASILGKLFARETEPALQPPTAASAPAGESAPLQSVFDRLRGTPAQAAVAPASAPRPNPPAASNSWLVNGPRRS